MAARGSCPHSWLLKRTDDHVHMSPCTCDRARRPGLNGCEQHPEREESVQARSKFT